MAFHTYTPARAHTATDSASLARHASGIIAVAWPASILPALKVGDRATLMVGTGTDRGKLAIAGAINGRGYKVGLAGDSGAQRHYFCFTPARKILTPFPAVQVWHHVSDGLLVLNVPDGLRPSIYADAPVPAGPEHEGEE
jgi:hypothetical protein